MKKVHPLFPELLNSYKKGGLPRREFLRLSALLGVAFQVPGLIKTPKAQAANVRRGGVLTIGSSMQRITHPAQFGWTQPANQMRQVAEYLTETGPDNITRPWLCRKWEASPDLKTWTLHLQKGVTFNNGDKFTAKDVAFTLNEWLNPATKSSLYGLIGGYLDRSQVEKVDEHTIRLHLKRPEIGLPEHLFHYPALVLNHRTFEGDFIKAPHGTGPYTLEKYREKDICVLKARKDYWQKGADGKPLPYLDGMTFIEMGSDLAPKIAALKSGEVDLCDLSDNPSPEAMLACKHDKNLQILSVATSNTRVIRMRTDQKPYDDVKIRQAVKLCVNPEKLLALAYMGEGLRGDDFHVYPNHPAYCPLPAKKYDPQKAKALLAEAGHPNGIKLTLSIGADWKDVVRIGEIMQQDAKPAGIDIVLKPMPTSQYWEKWTEEPFGITPWAHRSLETMVLNLAYTVDGKGQPVPWNETRWVDKEFVQLLEKANTILDIEARRKVMCRLEEIQRERGSIAIPYWMNMWMITNKKIKNVKAHPNLYFLFNEVWLAG